MRIPIPKLPGYEVAELTRLRAALDAANARADAIPREPTEAMQKAGLDAMFDVEHSDLKRKELYLLIRKAWRAMYDAAKGTTP